MQELEQIDKEIARVVKGFKPYTTWRTVGDMLGMTELQAQRYLEPLMGDETG